MIFLLLSSLHASIILGGDGPGGLSVLGMRNTVFCRRRYKHLCCVQKEMIYSLSPGCPGFGWDRVNFPPSICCVLDLAGEEC